MERIRIEIEKIITMAGEVTYNTKPCPFKQTSFYSMTYDSAMVGDTSCQMCKHYGGKDDDNVICNHE